MYENQIDQFKDGVNRPELFITRNRAKREATRKQLIAELERAVMLGNLYKEPAVLVITDGQGNHIKKEEIVITFTERYVTIRGGELIPISQIERLET